MTSSDLSSQLRQRGLRLTSQRVLVLDAVRGLGHATPDDVAASVADEGVNLSTVYRTLELLEELGLVAHTHLGHGAPTYHAAEDIDHLHLVCRECGSVSEADVALAADFAGTLAAVHGFEPDVKHFAIYGTCVACRGTSTDDAVTTP